MADPQLRAFFDSIDTDRSGQISVSELQKMFANCGFQFSLANCSQVRERWMLSYLTAAPSPNEPPPGDAWALSTQMIRMYDKEGAGSINFNEFTGNLPTCLCCPCPVPSR